MGPVAELAARVKTPAVRHPCGRNAAGVITTRAHNGEGEAARHWDRSAAADQGPVTELAGLIFSPTVWLARAS
jgi:hypothetical protein